MLDLPFHGLTDWPGDAWANTMTNRIVIVLTVLGLLMAIVLVSMTSGTSNSKLSTWRRRGNRMLVVVPPIVAAPLGYSTYWYNHNYGESVIFALIMLFVSAIAALYGALGMLESQQA